MGVTGEADLYQWVVLVPFEGAENGWTCTMVLVSPSLGSGGELLEQPMKEVGDATVSSASPAPLALVSRSDPLKIAEAYVADLLPAIKKGDKFEGFYTADCVFGNPDAGKPGEQKDVLMTGVKSVGLEAFKDEIKATKILSAVTGVVDAK